MSLAGLFVNEQDYQTLENVLDRIINTVQQKAGSLIAEEGGIIDAMLGRVFNTLDGAKVTFRHPALKDPLTITLELKKEKA